MSARGPDSVLRAYPNPLRMLFSASLWRAVAFLLSYVVVSVVLFAVIVTTSVASAALTFTVIAIPLLIAAAWIVHGGAAVQRGLLRLAFAGPMAAEYQQPAKPGLRAYAFTAWRSKATWRELAYLVGLFVPLFALDLIVFGIWAGFAGAISLPWWYSRPYTVVHGHRFHGISLGYFPNGPYGASARGVFIHTMSGAVWTAVVFAVLFVLFSYVVVLTARLHARIARALLRPPADPLAEARSVLRSPGPLGPLNSAR